MYARFWLMLAGIALSVASCTVSQLGSAAPSDPNVPGATGRTVVVGSHSSMAGSNRIHPDWAAAGVDAGAMR